MSKNLVVLSGHLGRDPELRTSASGKNSASFSVAVSRRFTDASGEKREETEWVNIRVYGKSAEFVSRYFKKGNGIEITGRLHSYEADTAEGKKRFTEVIADAIDFPPSSGTRAGGNSSGSGYSPEF